jgi:hypothetical protein
MLFFGIAQFALNHFGYHFTLLSILFFLNARIIADSNSLSNLLETNIPKLLANKQNNIL